ncbi:hypothetical protein ACIA8O_34375 [Kitasatospora sp. NPDC051853]|uniref:hypothetical protein n=1 Tax=Kitasatospora sp. NPDC051853 TaxID=3364058 RepID=UPI0037ADDC7D
MTDPWQELHAALDAFPATSDRFHLEACGHCCTAADLAALAGPPAAVPDRLLATVVIRSPGHWSDHPALIRRLTPRLMRAVLTDSLGVDEGSVGTRFRQAGWERWPEPERSALLGLWRAWFDLALRHHPAPIAVSSVLNLLAAATGTLVPWLDRWPAPGLPAADRQLSDLLDDWLVHDRADTLRLGHGGELLVGPELFTWLNGLAPTRLTPAQRYVLSLLNADRRA